MIRIINQNEYTSTDYISDYEWVINQYNDIKGLSVGDRISLEHEWNTNEFWNCEVKSIDLNNDKVALIVY